MGTKVSIDGLADAVMQGLNEYQALTNEGVKAAVKKAGDTVKNRFKPLRRNAPALMAGAGQSRPRGSPAMRWRSPCIPGTAISWPICWSSVMPSAAVVAYPVVRILHQLSRPSSSWRKISRGVSEMDRILDILQALGIPLPMTILQRENLLSRLSSAICSRPSTILLPMGRFISKRRKSTSSSTPISRMWGLRQVSKLCLMSTVFFMTKARSG